MFILHYAQPRPASFDPTVAIWERKECHIDAKGIGEAQETIKKFLAEGSVVCGETTHHIELLEFRELRPTLQPNPDFLAVGFEFP